MHENDLLSLLVISRKNGANIQFPPIEITTDCQLGRFSPK